VRSLVDELTHPVRESVPTDAATIERTVLWVSVALVPVMGGPRSRRRCRR